MQNKVCNTNLALLVASMMVAILVTGSEASYIDDASLTDSDSSESSVLSDKYTPLWAWLQKQRQEERQLPRTDDFSDSRNSLMASLLKRGVDFRSARSGGMALCLWKICPAAPWLINK